MRKTTAGVAIGVILIALALGSCRTGPIYNVKDATIKPLSGKKLTLEEVTRTIANAGNKHGWAMSLEEPGHLVATLSLRSHIAIVDITYTTESYNITYKDSENLKYDESSQSIHANYASWVKRLQVSIQRAFGDL